MDESSRKICTALVRNAPLPKIIVQLPPAAIEDSIRCATHHPWWKVKKLPLLCQGFALTEEGRSVRERLE